MGNGESTYGDDPHDDIQHYAPSYAGSSMETHHRHQEHASYIADNFNSLDEVFTVIQTC
jgi:E3 ubiquitin-protein ligase RGLG